MSISDYIAMGALFISAISLWRTFSVGRVRLKAWSQFIPVSEYNQRPYIVVQAVNNGHRPILLTLLGGNIGRHNWSATYIGKQLHEDKGTGLLLQEEEYFKRNIYYEDLVCVDAYDFHEYQDLWFENSLGRKTMVKNSRRNVKKLKEENSPQG
ncbi:MAG: hypothetical protein MRY79_05015 [Alphaproteobacteria bacterium]|nr:hypothetical protein [Alphaproteobacteria bacterium]